MKIRIYQNQTAVFLIIKTIMAKIKGKPKLIDFDDYLVEKLKDQELALEYLNTALNGLGLQLTVKKLAEPVKIRA